MQKSWEKLWEILKSEAKSHSQDLGGTPSYRLQYFPDEDNWIMSIFYSDGSQFYGRSTTEYDAIRLCYNDLKNTPYKLVY